MEAITVPDAIEEDATSEDALPDVPVVPDSEVPPTEGDAGEAGAGEDEDGAETLGMTQAATPKQRAECQRIIAKGCQLMLGHAGAVHYTQDAARRWNGINNDRRIGREEFPGYSDCSSSSTWLLWNALYTHLGWGDVVNGSNWTAGYTGTMLSRGQSVSEGSLQVGDCVIYGPPGSTGKHVVVCLGGGYAFSHGQEAGPFKVGIRHRSDIMSFRRYF